MNDSELSAIELNTIPSFRGFCPAAPATVERSLGRSKDEHSKPPARTTAEILARAEEVLTRYRAAHQAAPAPAPGVTDEARTSQAERDVAEFFDAGEWLVEDVGVEPTLDDASLQKAADDIRLFLDREHC